MGKSPGVLRNQNVYPMTSNTGNNKPAQWLTDPYSNSYSTPANKVNLFLFGGLEGFMQLEKKRVNAKRHMV